MGRAVISFFGLAAVTWVLEKIPGTKAARPPQ
jgi:hypothetical protein